MFELLVQFRGKDILHPKYMTPIFFLSVVINVQKLSRSNKYDVKKGHMGRVNVPSCHVKR